MKKWPIIRELGGGRLQVDLGRVFGKRIQRQFNNRVAAQEFVAQKRNELTNLGTHNAALLTDDAKMDAAAALKLMSKRASLTEAAQFYLRHAPIGSSSIKLTELIAEFLASKVESGKRPETVRGYRVKLGRLAATHGAAAVSEIGMPVLSAWIRTAGYTGVTRQDYITAFSVLFSFAVRRGYLLSNPVDAIERSTIDRPVPAIFTAGEVERLLNAAASVAPMMVPYFAIGVFAGLRPGELAQLRRESVDLVEGLINVTPATAKKRRHRFVDISPNLIQWLAAYPLAADVVPYIRKQAEAARKKAGVPWAIDIMRHTFASYHLAAHEDASRTMLQMGHRNADVLFEHYRHAVKKQQALAFWRIVPPGVGAHVLKLPPLEQAG